MDQLLQDIRSGIRALRRSPGFALAATLTLALGIGLATAVFTVAEAFLLRPLPVREQERVVVLHGASRDGKMPSIPLLLGDARELAAETRTLERVEFVSWGGAHLVPIRDGSSVYRLRRSLVSGGWFELLGARPVLGRALAPADDIAGAAPVVVLSHGAWRRRFGGDSAVVGRSLVLHENGVAHAIVGVMPPGLELPRGTDFWAPVIPSSKPLGDQPVYAELELLGRLRPGATAADARAELTAFLERPGASPFHREAVGAVTGLTETIVGDVRPAVLAFAAAAGLLLLVTCINAANLLLVRGLGRAREVAVRAALGSGRGRIVRQLVTESAVLAALGGAAGVVLAAWAVHAFVALAPAGTPRLDEVALNGTAVAAAIALTTLVTLLVAVAPALATSRVGPGEALRAASARAGGGRGVRLGAEALVAGQVGLAVVVLAAAGLVGRSLVALQRVDLALDPSRLLVVELAVPHEAFGDTRRQRALLDDLVPRLEATPGVEAVAPVLTAPFVDVGGIVGKLLSETQGDDEAARNPALTMEVVTPGFFEAFGLPVLRGRALSAEDRAGAAPVVVIGESVARHYWPGGDAVGERLTWRRGVPGFTVVGVVPDTRWRDLREPRPTVYFPLAQSSFPVVPTTLAICTNGSPAALVPIVRRVVGEAGDGVAVASAAPFEALLDGPLAQPRLDAMLLAMFAGAAVALAAVGLFAVMATMVRQRTRELGVRMALGATAGDVGRMVLRRGVAIAAIGTAAGLLGALAANRGLSSLLYEVAPTDAATLAGVAALLLAVAALASAIPARASARIEPVEALRAE